MITQERLKELLHYDQHTGLFTWVKSPNRFMKLGDIAGSNASGYLKTRIDGCYYMNHRLAFLYMNGSFPKDMVDHINGVRNDNRWTNLRDATRQMNGQNRRRAENINKSGLLGVVTFRNKWVARIRANGKNLYLGIFTCPNEAHQAYLKAKRELHAGCTI
jgi:hypothetical protein